MKNKISTFVKSFWKAIFIVGFLFSGQQVSAETVLKVIPHADLKNIDPILEKKNTIYKKKFIKD